MSDSLRPHGLYPTRLLCPWDFPGNSTGVDCHFLLQGIFPNQGLNPGLPHCRQTLYCLTHREIYLLLSKNGDHNGTYLSYPGGAIGKEPACQCRRWKRCEFDPRVGKIPWRRAWLPTLVFLPGESHGQRSLVGHSP